MNDPSPPAAQPPTASSAVAGAPAPRVRRQILAAGAVALVAAGGGIAFALRRTGRNEEGAANVADQKAIADLWQTPFDTPAGTPLDLGALKGRAVLINFWATWCPPCVAELPLLDQFHASQPTPGGWQVLGLAVDQPSSVRKFLQRVPVRFPIGMAGLGGTELSKNFGNTQGGLPFSVFVASDGRVVARKIGQLDEAEIKRWTANV